METKKRKKITGKKVGFTIFMALDIALIVFLYLRGNVSNATTKTTTNVSEETVSTRTITNTLTGSGQISSATTENLSLSTSKYFKTMCIEEDEYVAEGENILEYSNGTYLTAPYDLVVESYSVPTTGSICTSSNYVKVESLDDLYMTLSIDESEIGSVKVGQSASITVNANENTKYTGTITKINQLGTYASSGSTFTATIKIENDGNIKIGMSASCTITLEEKTSVVAVPIEAVQTKNDEKYVVVVNSDGSTSNVDVTTGISDDSYVEITSGLSGGETIQMKTTTTQSTGTSSSKSSKSSTTKGASSSLGGFSGGPSSSTQGGSMPSGGGMPN